MTMPGRIALAIAALAALFGAVVVVCYLDDVLRNMLLRLSW